MGKAGKEMHVVVMTVMTTWTLHTWSQILKPFPPLVLVFSSLSSLHSAIFTSCFNLTLIAHNFHLKYHDSFKSPPSAMDSNHMMTSIHGVEDIIGYHFTNPSMIWEALQAAGSPVYVIGNRRLVDGNKRLALLGDTVLQLALAETWLDANEPRGNEENPTELHGTVG